MFGIPDEFRSQLPLAAQQLLELMEQQEQEERDGLGTEAMVEGRPRGEYRLGVLLKRTYRIGADGRCELAAEDAQEPISEEEVVYDVVDPPLVSSLRLDDDTRAFRDRTDVVVQGSAYTHAPAATSTRVTLQCGAHRRDIDVWGDRRAELGADGQIRFGDPEPFDELPLRYELAYGGVDVTALARYGLPDRLEELRKARPEWPVDRDTPYHYPRNPGGRGFLIEVDEESVAALRVPNLEYPFDRVTPDRLAVGHPDRWPVGPLPAGFDWFSPRWFPRTAWLGLAGPAPRQRGNGSVREIELGWAPEDLLDIEPVSHTLPRGEMRQEYFQAASPGLSFDDLGPGTLFELRNLHPQQPDWRFVLPDEVPRVRLGITAPSMTDLEPHLTSVVIRPDADEAVVTWCASIAVDRRYPPEQALEMRREVEWKR